MVDLFEFIFSSLWTYLGTVFLIYSVGHALSFPFYWQFKTRQFKMNRSIWSEDLN
jgi:hypothetical protein